LGEGKDGIRLPNYLRAMRVRPVPIRPATVFPVLLMLAASGMMGQGSFIRTLGGPLATDGVGVLPVDGGFLVAARVFDGVAQRHRAVVMVRAANGQPLSETTLAIDGGVFLQAMAPAEGGGAFLAGSAIAPGAHTHDGLLVKLGMDHRPLWMARPPFPGDQQYLGVAPLPDGGAVVCGLASSGDGHDVLAVRFAADGNLLWTRTVPGPLDEEAYAVATDGTGIMLAGRRMNFGGTSDMLGLRLALDGTVLWTSSWGGALDEEARAIARTADGHFILAGHTRSFGPADRFGRRQRNIWLVKVGAGGDTLWTRAYGDTLTQRGAYAIDVAANGDLLVGGEWHLTYALGNALAIRCTSDGQPVWERMYNAGKEDRILSLRALPDGLVATGRSFTPEGGRALLARRNATGD